METQLLMGLPAPPRMLRAAGSGHGGGAGHVADELACRRMRHVAETFDVRALVRDSASGSAEAWQELVNRYAPLVMSVIRNHRLTGPDAQDVSQTVWLRLVESLPTLREPEALPGWLSTTTQRECTRQIGKARRVLPVDPQVDGAMQQATADEPDAALLQAEMRQALREGLAELPARDQWLLRLRSADPPASYAEISRLLDMPVGSIGPTLRRCLDRLRDTAAMRRYTAAAQLAARGEGGDQRELAEVD
jgi:RNA polymerase sigma factor (sigma-70 family)